MTLHSSARWVIGSVASRAVSALRCCSFSCWRCLVRAFPGVMCLSTVSTSYVACAVSGEVFKSLTTITLLSLVIRNVLFYDFKSSVKDHRFLLDEELSCFRCVHPKLKEREFLLVRVAFRQQPRSLDNGVVSSVLKLDGFENLGLIAVHAPVVDFDPVDDDGPLLF